MIFEIDNVELYFKTKRILSGIYLKAEAGKVTGILGRNGSGKSCLLEVAFGNLSPKYKSIRIDSSHITKSLYKTGIVKYLPQYHFAPKNAKILWLFKLFNINWDEFIYTFPEFSEFQSLKIKQLSGGLKRLIEIYLVLKSESKIVLLDEPFNGIAPVLIQKVKSLIEQEKLSKIIILTDHRYEEVINISENIYLLTNGYTKQINHLNELEDYKYLPSNKPSS